MEFVSQPLISVVTPVYNGEKYLAECIESVLAQTYQNWDYVIVNNGSQDRSLEIAQSYAARDPRIRIHNNQEFLKAIPNFNHSMRQISPESKYCKVVHADDWLFPDCIEEMVRVAEENPLVGVVGSYVLEGTRISCDGLPYPSTVTSGRAICRALFLNSDLYLFGTPTSTLLRADLVRSRPKLYDEYNVRSTDQEVCYDLLQESDFGFVHKVLSFTRLHEESQTSIQQQLNTYYMAKLSLLTKYGPVYLKQPEYNQLLGKLVTRYYTFLAGNLAGRRKDEKFWKFHHEVFEHFGLPFNQQRLVKAFLKHLYVQAVTNYLLHPKYTFLKMVGRPPKKNDREISRTERLEIMGG